ncbi:MAG: Gfo/Idh/MocA family protein [Candidatus Zipacnadales bacterium]
MMDKIGFGLIGTGTWGETHLKLYSTDPRVNLACICDINEELVKQRAAEFHAGAWTTDYRELLARDDVDAVAVVTPDHLHREIAVAAAEAGKHILLEKPMAKTIEDCEAINAAAAKAGVKLMVDFHNRFNTPFTQAKLAIEVGELGELQMASLRLNDTIFVPTQMLSWAANSSVAWFIGSHSVDLLRWLLEDEVVRVYSVARSRVLQGMGIDTPDFFQTILEFSRGAVAHVENCWILAESYPTVFDFKVELVGSKGHIMADLSGHRMLAKYTPESGSYPDVIAHPMVHGRVVGFAVESLRHFIECLIEDKEPLVTGADGLAATKVILAIEKSVETGKPVEV